MEWLNNIWASVSVSAIVQIAILYVVIYAILKYAKGSRFGQVLMGVGLLAAVMIAFTFLFHFDVLSIIVRSLLVYLAISTVVIFQPEIRRVLGQVGAFGFLDKPKYAADGSLHIIVPLVGQHECKYRHLVDTFLQLLVRKYNQRQQIGLMLYHALDHVDTIQNLR